MAAALIAIGRGLILRKKHSLAEAPKYKAPATLVDTATAYLGDLPESHEYLAVIEPVKQATVTARVTATVESVAVDEGDSVTLGQTIITLDHRQTDAQLASLEAQIKETQADLEGSRGTVASLQKSLAYWERETGRDKQLAERETIPGAEAEATAEKKNEVQGNLVAAQQKSNALVQQIASLRAKAEELCTMLSYCVITSPFAAVVTSRNVDSGDQAAPGKALLVLQDAGSVMVTFDVPQTDLPAVKPGLELSFQANGETRTARITRLYPALNRARMLRAEVVLAEAQAAGLTLGQYMTATVVFQRHEQVPLIPVSALIERGLENPQVFVMKDGHLEARGVKVLGTACEQAAVEGVEPGEEVVVNSFLGWARLADGMNVEAR
ncbi:MAG: efflux RND transporter periplasmic adaptor subunit [Nitrospiraceae bacterium]|nr:efflux RND transporter periplasmic adaptor subunit [Nitrospiraceae bacterium]